VERVFLGLGSNLGDRLGNLRQALCLLGQTGTVTSASSLYETEPVGYAVQGWFLNGACELRTGSQMDELLAQVKSIEEGMGRTPGFRNAPRIIDIDILLAGDLLLDLPDLQIPHPRLPQRRFVLAPLAEIAGEVIHPALHRTIQELLNSLPQAEAVGLWGPPDVWFPPC
jgi:2-amino-4-hydroxy-6-hydroxymethyldihydropteridine diphosphokinase